MFEYLGNFSPFGALITREGNVTNFIWTITLGILDQF